VKPKKFIKVFSFLKIPEVRRLPMARVLTPEDEFEIMVKNRRFSNSTIKEEFNTLMILCGFNEATIEWAKALLECHRPAVLAKIQREFNESFKESFKSQKPVYH
jgi:hypothetical protein